MKAKLTELENNDMQAGEDRSLKILAIEDPLIGLPNRRAMGIDLRHAAEIASKRICRAISEEKIAHEQSSFGHLTVSIGVAGGVTDNWEAIIEQADSALHDAKDKGRNTVCVIAATEDSQSGDLG